MMNSQNSVSVPVLDSLLAEAVKETDDTFEIKRLRFTEEVSLAELIIKNVQKLLKVRHLEVTC